jgi:hypothetical protein
LKTGEIFMILIGYENPLKFSEQMLQSGNPSRFTNPKRQNPY